MDRYIHSPPNVTAKHLALLYTTREGDLRSCVSFSGGCVQSCFLVGWEYRNRNSTERSKSGPPTFHTARPAAATAESPDAYTTPALLRYGNKTEIVISGGDYVTGHDPATGEELWRAGGLNPNKDRANRIVASPVVADGIVCAPSRVRPILALKAGGRGDVSKSHLVWTADQGPDVPTPATDGKYIFILNDRGILWCRDAKSGVEIWGSQRARPGTYSTSPVIADGKLYVTSEDGITAVLEAGPEFKVLGENDLFDYTLSSPAISDGQIFMRTQGFLYCIGKRQ